METSDILIRKIAHRSEIVDKCTWVLVNDGGSNVLLHRASKDVAKALSDGMRCYYVSPDVFVGDFHFDNVLFTEKPNGLSVDVSFRMKLLPEMSGFADWVKTNVEYKLTTGEFVERLSKPKYGLKQFLQHSLEGVTNFDLLRKHGKEAVPTFAGQDKSVEPWLYVVGMQWIEADDIPASKRNWLKEFSAQQEERTKELEQMRADLSFATEKGNLDDAMKIVAQRLKLNYLAREVECRKAEGALKDVEIENANKELELLERKKRISILSKAETDRYGELENILNDYHNAQKKIEVLEDEIRRLSVEKDKEDPDAWYNNLSRKGKIFRHIRTIFACLLYVCGWIPFLSGCGMPMESVPSIITDYAFVVTAICWLVAMLLNSKNVKDTITDVRRWVGNLLSGRPSIDMARLIESFFRCYGGCFLVFAGMYSIVWVFGLFMWAYTGFQKAFFVGLEVIFMALSGVGCGAYVLGMKLMMRRRVCSAENSTRKWIMIMALPMLLFFFFDKTAKDRIKWPNEDKKAARAAINEFNNAEAAIRAFEMKDYEKAWKLVEYANGSDVRLIAHIANAYYCGNMGVSVDYEKALTNYKKLLGNINESKEPSLYYCIGQCYKQLGVYSEALSWFNKAAKAGCEKAYLRMGEFYEVGNSDIKRNKAKALLAYSYVSNSKNAEVKASAEKAIGRLTEKLLCKENDANSDMRADEHLKHQTDTVATGAGGCTLGCKMPTKSQGPALRDVLVGIGRAERDGDNAILVGVWKKFGVITGLLLEQCLDTGNDVYRVCDCYNCAMAKANLEIGVGVECQEYAQRWYEKAIEEGCEIALIRLGLLYRFGRLGRIDGTKARSLFERASQSHDQHISALGRMLLFECKDVAANAERR